MAVINILSPHVADLIAAGEVVERPASVVKELVENSLDAGAKNITVEVRGGGALYIRVTDDGCGMTPEDAGVAFLRHATSKLADERGLEAISTMGFRGEALAAIASVSEIELITRPHAQIEGTRLTLSAGEIDEMDRVGCPEGTSITVRDLFYNTPARKKFLKSDRSEASACELAALRCALGHPEVSVRFIRDGRESFFSPGDCRGESCVYSLLGREAAAELLPCVGTDGGMTLRGFISSPSAGRGNRSAQFFYCNGRFIRSQLMQTALENAYKNTLLTGRYPACVLYLTLGCGSVDVNVHPAKTEVKFSEEKRVYDLVYYTVLSTLGSEDRTPAAPEKAPEPAEKAPEPIREAPKPEKSFFRSMSAQELRAAVSSEKRAEKADSSTLKAAQTPYEAPAPLPLRVPTAVPERRIVEKPVQNVETQPLPDYKIVGEALKTYIIVETGGGLLLIDKHAAHERMIFDRLKAQKREIMSQTLLFPATVRLPDEDRELLERNAELLSELGFEIEPISDRELAVRAVPADMLPSDAAAAVEEICESLRSGRRTDGEELRDAVLRTAACKAAIKAGWDTDERELRRVAEEVLSGRVKYCPHGRPVSVPVTKNQLEKMFKRIV